MPYGSEAYDFSLFETHYDNTVPVRQPDRRPVETPRRRVLEFPTEQCQQQEERQPRAKRHPLRATFYVSCFGILLFLAVSMVYSQQQMASLTDQISTATEVLEQTQSVEVQLNMEAARKMTNTQVEAYAAQVLGMGKITSAQVTYVNVAGQDQGTVVQDAGGGSFLDRLWSRIIALFS